MLRTLAQSFARLSTSAAAGPSSLRLASMGSASGGRRGGAVQVAVPLAFACSPAASASLMPFAATTVARSSRRHASQLAPRRTKYRKAHKGSVPLHTGGSLKGTTLSQGEFGIRLLQPARLSAKQLQSAEAALKRKLKVIKGSQVYLRVFPDIAVCAKGNETRMGKGKGSFQFWATRATVGKVIFEIGGPVEIRPEVAKEALRLASAKLPVKTEFITRETAPRLGSLVETSLPPGAAHSVGGAGVTTAAPTAGPAPVAAAPATAASS